MKKEEKTEITKERILKAAIEEFGTKGYAAASLNNICGTGISKGLLYHNFENKDAVYLACVKHCFDSLTACLAKQGKGAQLRGYMDARMRFFEENPYLARLFFESVLQTPEELAEKVRELQADFNSLNRKLFEEMLAAVTLRDGVTQGEAMQYFLMMQNMYNGCFHSLAGGNVPFAEAMAAHESGLSKLLDLMLYGIAERGNLE